MSSEAFTPITSIQEPSLQGMPRTYTSQREVAAEWEPPVRGTVVGDILPRYKTHIVLDAQAVPKSGKRVAIISHCSAPDWYILLGSGDRLTSKDAFLYERQVVPTPTQADIEADPFSTYEPIDETKSLKVTKIPRRKNADGTYEDGYSQGQMKSIGVENLIPQKFRTQTITIETSNTEPLAASEVNDIPDPETPTGDQVKIVHEKLNDEQYARTVTEEIINENLSPLTSPSLEDQLYVTTEILVAAGTAPDTGTGVVTSEVADLGNGKAVKTTKFAVTAYTNASTYTLGYATLLNENVGSADSIPAKFRALKSLKTWRLRVQAAAPPTTPALGTGIGDYTGYDIVERAVKQTQENGNSDVYEMVIVGLSNTGDNAIDSTTYGKIVTTTTTETLALASQAIDTGISVISSTVEELGNGMTIKATEQVQGGTWPDPVENEASKEIPDVIPAKFRRSVTQTRKSKKIAAIPETITLGTDEKSKIYKKETPDRVDELTITETIDTNAAPLVGERVTETMIVATSEELVDQGEPAAKGFTVASAEVDALGNGDAVASSAIAKKRNTSDAIVTGWPVKQTKVVGTDPEVPARYADQVVSVDTITQVSLAAADVDDIPAPSDPTGEETQIIHEKVNDYRLQQTKRSKTISLDPDWLDTDIEVRPGVKIMTRAKGGLEAAPPILGSGSAKLVWKAGEQKIYENSDVDAQARPGLKGYSKNLMTWGSFTERTDYSENYADGEESRIIYDDEEIRVYEVTNLVGITISSTGRTKDKDPQQWGTLTWNGLYQQTEDAACERVKIIWQRGNFQVWHNEKASIEVDGTTFDKDPQQWGQLIWRGAYSEIQNEQADRTRQVWRLGNMRVFLNETVEVQVGGTTKDIDAQQWGSLTWNGTYQTEASGTRSRQVWRLGENYVYLNESPSVDVSGGTKDRDPQAWGTLAWVGTYGTAESVDADRSRQVWRMGNLSVWLNESANITVSGTTIDKDPQSWGSLTWNGQYSTEQDLNADRTRQVWRMGEQRVFLNETAAVSISGTTRDTDPQQWGSLTWNGTYAAEASGERSRQVWRMGDKTVYLNESPTIDVSGTTLDTDPQSWGSLTWNGIYATAPGGERSRQVWRVGSQSVYLNETSALSVSGTTKDVDPQTWGSLTWNGTYATESDGTRSRQVWRMGSKAVYLNEEPALSISGTTYDSDPQQWGTLIWNGVYSSTQDQTIGNRSRQVYRVGSYSVFLNEVPNPVLAPGSHVSAREENALLIETQTTSYGFTYISGNNTRSRLIYSLGSYQIYENTTITRTSKGSRFYPSSVNGRIPAQCMGIEIMEWQKRKGGSEFVYTPNVREGYSGSLPCTVEEYWQENPGAGVQAQIFKPSPIVFDTPLGRCSVESTLHGTITLTATVGTKDPFWKFGTYSATFPATDPPTVPAEFVQDVESVAYREGYIVRIYRVNLA